MVEKDVKQYTYADGEDYIFMDMVRPASLVTHVLIPVSRLCMSQFYFNVGVGIIRGVQTEHSRPGGQHQVAHRGHGVQRAAMEQQGEVSHSSYGGPPDDLPLICNIPSMQPLICSL